MCRSVMQKQQGNEIERYKLEYYINFLITVHMILYDISLYVFMYSTVLYKVILCLSYFYTFLNTFYITQNPPYRILIPEWSDWREISMSKTGDSLPLKQPAARRLKSTLPSFRRSATKSRHSVQKWSASNVRGEQLSTARCRRSRKQLRF